jgi:hypothetical protein
VLDGSVHISFENCLPKIKSDTHEKHKDTEGFEMQLQGEAGENKLFYPGKSEEQTVLLCHGSRDEWNEKDIRFANVLSILIFAQKLPYLGFYDIICTF